MLLQILPVRPNAVLRTMTGNTGTVSPGIQKFYITTPVIQEYYRAPEVHRSSGYDPGYADIWSIGMTLFFFVCAITMLPSLVASTCVGWTGINRCDVCKV